MKSSNANNNGNSCSLENKSGDTTYECKLQENCATLLLPESKEIKVNICTPVSGLPALNISPLANAGFFTYDPAFMSTASCWSKITYIDGIVGELRYRGYDIAELAEHSSFIETFYLLLYGELPLNEQLTKLRDDVQKYRALDDTLIHICAAFDSSASPMAILGAMMNGLAAIYGQECDVHDDDYRKKIAYILIGKIPAIIACIYRHTSGKSIIKSGKYDDYCSDFLYMMFEDQDLAENPNILRALNVLLILHADHEQNASTSTVRMSGSSNTHPFAAIAAGVAALWGHLHGGANEEVLKMLEEIATPDRVQLYVDKAIDKEEGFRLFGFGHRVYKNYDPRAKIIKKMCDEVLSMKLSKNDPLLDIALQLEEIALTNQYFIERKLYPNVDFYSGIIYRALMIPTNMFTPMFAFARCAGWISQWNEMMSDPELRIARPRQLYLGAPARPYPTAQRK